MTHEDIARVIAGMLKEHNPTECIFSPGGDECENCILHEISRGCGADSKHIDGSVRALTELLYTRMQKGLLEESPDDK